MTEKELLLNFAKKIRSRMSRFDVWYVKNVHGSGDMWKYSAKSVDEITAIGNLYRQLEEDLGKMEEIEEENE